MARQKRRNAPIHIQFRVSKEIGYKIRQVVKLEGCSLTQKMTQYVEQGLAADERLFGIRFGVVKSE